MAGLELPSFIIAVLALGLGLLKTSTKYERLSSNAPESTEQSARRNDMDLERARPVFRLEFDHRSGMYPYMKKVGDTLQRQFRGQLRNTGGSVSKITIHYNYQEHRPKNLEEILNKKDFFRKNTIDGLGSMAKDSTIIVNTPKFEWSKELWFVLWIDYEYLNGIKEECVFDLNINGESVSVETIRYFSYTALADVNST